MITLVTEKEARKMNTCPGCGKPKIRALIVCTDCFKNRQDAPFRTFTGTFADWQKQIHQPPPAPPVEPPSPAEFYGEPISVYSRAQAIEDGFLVDLMQEETIAAVKEAGFRYPVAMTIAAFSATIGAPDVPLPPGQDIQGRLWDVLYMLRCAIKRPGGGSDRVKFCVSVFDGAKHNTVNLWSSVGPGDTHAPVITIMLQGED